MSRLPRLLRLPPVWLVLALLGSGAALAHKGSDAYLDVRQPSAGAVAEAVGQHNGVVPERGVNAPRSDPRQPVQFVLSVALRDLDQVVAIDANSDAKVTWGEVKAALPELLALLNQTANTAPLAPSGAEPATGGCRLDWRSDGLERRSDGTYLRAVAATTCPSGQSLVFHYTLFRGQDATHRLLVGGRIGLADLLTTTSPQQTAPLLLRPATAAGPGGDARRAAAGASGRWSTVRDYFLLGMHHLLQGYDHLAFLLALVLPLQLVLIGRAGAVGAGSPGSGRSGWMALLRSVTAFTIGHSVTLVLATLGWIDASPAWVEPVIALSIAATAGLNLWPVRWLRVESLALGFGMVHGYGFAGLLLEVAAPAGLLPWALAGFNLGVEGGQLLAVAGWVLLSQVVVRRSWYADGVVRGGSWLLMALAVWWFYQRVA